MIPVAEALDRLFALAPAPRVEEVPLIEAGGRVLLRPLHAFRAQPPFAASAMDGYAVRAADVAAAAAGNPVTLAIIERVAAGAVPTRTVGPGTAARIMTGAPLPDGADSVVPFEETDEPQNRAATMDAVRIYVAPVLGASVRPAGEITSR